MNFKPRKTRVNANIASCHTNIPIHIKKKLLAMGNEVLSNGIVNAVSIAEGKNADVKEILLLIANEIIYKYKVKEKEDLS